VLDEDFVRAGRREESAADRLARLERIARENASRDGWRSDAPVPVLAHPRRGHRVRNAFASVVLVGGLLAGALWWETRGPDYVPELAGRGQPAAEGPAEAPAPDPAPAEPVAPPERLLPLPADPGGEDGYRFLSTQEDETGRPVAYDPCRPISYVVRRAGEPPGGDEMLVAAVAEISAATGLAFERGPDTDEPLVDRRKTVQPERYGDRIAPVLVAWSDERESPDLAGYIAGVAGSEGFGWRSPGGDRYVTGMVLLDAEDAVQALRSRGGAAQLRSTILHELGHLVGLNHVSDRDQIMFSEGGDNRLDLGPGDRRGLRLLGDGQCFTDWDEVLDAAR
jgi:hypothetical protein